MNPYPSVLNQGIEGRFLPHDPQVRNYNSGMIMRADGTFFSTRFLNPLTHRSDIAITRMHAVVPPPGDTKHVTTMLPMEQVCVLHLPRQYVEHFEDGRLFRHQGRIYLSYIEGHYYKMPFNWVQKLALLGEDWSVEKTWTIPYAGNSVTPEKNWGFFSEAGFLHFVHQIADAENNHVVVTLDASMQPLSVHKRHHDIAWPWGMMSGGTPPILTSNGFLSFFHSYIKEKPHERRYCMAAYRFDRTTFAITGYTDPLIWASEEDPVLPNQLYTNWLPLVIFPCGVINFGESILVSAGVNDSTDVLLDVHADKLKFHDVRRGSQ